MGKPSPQAQPQPTPPPAPTPTAPPEPVKKVEPVEAVQPAETTAAREATKKINPKAAVGASGTGYSGTGNASRTTLTGARGLRGMTPVRRPMLTGSMGTAYKTTLGG